MADVAALGISVDSRQAVSAAGDLDKLSAASGRAETSTQKLARSIGVSEERMARYAAAATRVGVAVAAAGVAAAGALALMVKRTLENVDEQAKLSRQLGGTIDGLRGLQIAAADAGVDTGALASSLGRFQAVLGEAERGTGTAVDALDRLGLSAAELSALDIDERLAVIIERMEGLGLSATQSADVLRQFGIRNAEVLRLVQQGADVLRASREEVDAFGLSISAVDASAIERANDAMSRISRVVEVFATRLTVALAPALEVVANWLNELTRQNGGWRDVATSASDWIVRSLLWVVEAYEEVNEVAARFMLFLAETQAAAARFGVTARELLGFDATQYQNDLIAAAEAQRAYVEQLESTESAADTLRRLMDEARAAGAEGVAEVLPLADIALGAGEVTAAVETAAAAVEELRTKADVLGDIENLRFALMTDEETMIAERDSRLELLREALEMEAITKAEYRELEMAAIAEFDEWRLAQAQQAADEHAAIEARVASDIISMRQTAANNAVAFLQVLGQKSKIAALAAIALNKGLMIAQTIQNGAAAEIRALAELGPIAGAAAAAKIKAWTFANVGLIAATGLAQAAGGSATQSEGGSAGGGGSFGTAGPTPAPAPAAPTQDVTIRIDSDRNIFTRADIQQIIEGISDAVGDGANLRLASA